MKASPTPFLYSAEAAPTEHAPGDILLHFKNRSLPMLGPGGPARELAFLSPLLESPNGFTPGGWLPVLLGSGTGAALEKLTTLCRERLGPDFPLAVVDRERPILEVSRLREQYASYPGIIWLSAEEPGEILRHLSAWQARNGDKPFFPFLNPLYTRLNREFYAPLKESLDASRSFNLWGKTAYAKFTTAVPRLLLLTSKYFLMGEIQAACKRLGYEHELLQIPRGETGSAEFVESLLEAVLRFKPDFIFTINHLGVDKEGILSALLERLRLPIASWFVDNPFLVLGHYDNLVSDWTAIFTWDADNVANLRAMGFSRVMYLPLGADIHRFHPPRPGYSPPPEWRADVSFVGNSMVEKVRAKLHCLADHQDLLHNYQTLAAEFAASDMRSVRAFLQTCRQELASLYENLPDPKNCLDYEALLTWEATRQYRLDCIGGILPFNPLIVGDKSWKLLLKDTPLPWRYHREVSYYDDLPLLYPASTINFNCTSKQMKGAVNQRVFDVPATGSFCLTDKREQLEALLEPGKEIVCYATPEEARELTARYLRDDAARKQIAMAGRKRIEADHSYDRRLTTLVDAMRSFF